MRNRITEIVKQTLCPIPVDKQDPNYRFYFKNYQDNLLYPMASQHRAEYGEGNGSELEAKGTRPAKMASIVSSSAMTFNLLGNHQAKIIDNPFFEPGTYQIAYEKKLPTLNKWSSPANLDAFLYNEEADEAIFCEMKMMEWLGKPGVLKAAYLDEHNYFNSASGQVFSRLAESMIGMRAPDQATDFVSCFERYDAWQMFKHIIGIYNATSFEVKEQLEQTKHMDSLAGKFKNITLVNVVFELRESMIENEKLREKYHCALRQEEDEACAFTGFIQDTQSGLAQLFKDHCHAQFNVLYLPVPLFTNAFEKSKWEKECLKRYGF